MQNSSFHTEVKDKLHIAGWNKKETSLESQKHLDIYVSGLDYFDKRYSGNVKEAAKIFLDTEFDYSEDKGLKGVGRTTSGVPRLAGYVKEYVIKEDLEKFRRDADFLLMKGFLSAISFRINKDYIPIPRSSEELYFKFVSQIYTSGGQIFPDFQTQFSILADDDIERIVEELYILSGKCLDEETLAQIFVYYLIAGVLLETCLVH